jgi:hypothetical protein
MVGRWIDAWMDGRTDRRMGGWMHRHQPEELTGLGLQAAGLRKPDDLPLLKVCCVG